MIIGEISIPSPRTFPRDKDKAYLDDYIPVIVDFCLWEDLDLAKYNALPDKDRPVMDTRSWVNES